VSPADRQIRFLVRYSGHVRDVTLADELLRHMDVLTRFAGIDLWTDTRIKAGDTTQREIDQAIDQAHVALLLISSDFLASDTLLEHEVPRLLSRHQEGQVRVILVLLRSCLWKAHPWLKDLYSLPRNGQAIGSLSNRVRDSVLAEIVREVAEVAEIALSTPVTLSASTSRREVLIHRPAVDMDLVDMDWEEGELRTNVLEEEQRVHQEPPKLPCLLVLLGSSLQKGLIYKLKEGHTIIGRAQRADIRILDDDTDSVSRRHARIVIGQYNRVTIEDLGSANGTTVNAARVSLSELQDGDKIGIGPHVLLKFAYVEESVVDSAQTRGQPGESGTRRFLSTFISYGGPDEPFARKLNEALLGYDVLTFFFPENAVPGEKIQRAVRKKIQEHERVILICSRASLDRRGVLAEIEETIDREHRDGADYLIPIRLDDYVMTSWKPNNQDLVQTILSRVVADFEGADKDDRRFQTGLRKLIAALKK
jgi:hypothetical protein